MVPSVAWLGNRVSELRSVALGADCPFMLVMPMQRLRRIVTGLMVSVRRFLSQHDDVIQLNTATV